MLFFHRTSQAGRQGIQAEGFAVSHLRDSEGANWFVGHPDPLVPTGRDGWWVIVDLPDDVAARYEHRFEDGTRYEDTYLVPWGVMNRYRPFRYAPFDRPEEIVEDPAG